MIKLIGRFFQLRDIKGDLKYINNMSKNLDIIEVLNPIMLLKIKVFQKWP